MDLACSGDNAVLAAILGRGEKLEGIRVIRGAND
jgi:hypothetical protein